VVWLNVNTLIEAFQVEEEADPEVPTLAHA
jgi:hypothetical protein